jgi:hypothetical protein
MVDFHRVYVTASYITDENIKSHKLLSLFKIISFRVKK